MAKVGELIQRARVLLRGEESQYDKHLRKMITQVGGTEEYRTLDEETRRAIEAGLYLVDVLEELEDLPAEEAKEDTQYFVLSARTWYPAVEGPDGSRLHEQRGLWVLNTQVGIGQTKMPWTARWPEWAFCEDGVPVIRRP